MDPATLLNHPIPVRNLILQVPKTLLTSLLTHHDHAYQPLTPVVTSITPNSITISYLQPLREVYYKPIPRIATIPFSPPLPPIPPSDSPPQTLFEWESTCATRLKEMESAAVLILENRSDIVVTRYLPPNSVASVLSVAWFVALSAVMVLWIFRGESTPLVGGILGQVFDKSWKFDVAAAIHAAIIVKKCGDVLKVASMLRQHGVDKKRGVWICWVVNVGLEGWRCVRRFEGEVARVGRGLAVGEEGAESKKEK